MLEQKKHEVVYLILVTLLYAFFCLGKIIQFPIFIDEAVTYIWFTSKGISTSVMYYPSTNNHILFSIITNLFDFLPFNEKIILRLPNLFLGIACSLMIYFILKKQFNVHIARIAHCIFTFSYVFLLYSIMARGYMLYILFASICFYSVVKLIEDEKSRKYWKIFIVSSILGLYTIPTFIYATASFFVLFVAIFIKIPNSLKKLVLNHLVIGGVVCVLYLPVLYFNGYNSIMANNDHLASLPMSVIVGFLKENISGFYNILLGIRSDYIFVIYFSILLYFYFTKKSQSINKKIILILFLFVFPFVFLLMQKIIPVARMWSYLIFPFVFGLGIIFQYSIKIYKVSVVYSAILLLIILQLYVFNKTHPYSFIPRDIESQKMAEILIRKNFRTCYFYAPRRDEECIISYNYLSLNKPFFERNYYFRDSTLNCTPKQIFYDCIVIFKKVYSDIDQSVLRSYRLIYSNDEYFVYCKDTKLSDGS